MQMYTSVWFSVAILETPSKKGCDPTSPLRYWINGWPTVLAVGAGGGYLDIFTLMYPFSLLSPFL